MGRKTVIRQNRRKQEGKAARECTVLVASDWAPIRTFDPLIRQTPAAIYGDLLPLLRAADLRVVNCECAFTAQSRGIWKSGAVFKGSPEHISGLTVVPFDIACLANNHVFDYGLTAFRKSLDLLHRNGIRTVGAGLTEEEAYQPLSVRVRGNRITFINICEGEDLTASSHGPGVFGWNLSRAASLVRDQKKHGGCVIVIAHCGLEYVPYPPTYVVDAFRALTEAGADCVIGHHPHVPQGIEWYRGRPIVYSLGNFVFWQHTGLYYRKVGFCVKLGICEGSINGLDLVPYRIKATGLQRLVGGEERRFRRKIVRLSRPFQSTHGPAKAWQAYLAFYGTAGFTGEIRGILERMQEEPRKGAAMFRNRITTPQHAEFWRDFLTRIVDGEKAPYSRDAYHMIEEWFTRTVA